MEDIIKRIAESFGWDKGSYWLIHEARSCCPYDCTEEFSLIVFTAYAKAEMAKRGWALESACTGRIWATNRTHDCGAADYDPTDPISEANASIRCIHSVLQSNA